MAEAARSWGVSVDTVKRRLRRGELHGRKQPRPQGFTWLIELEQSLNGTNASTQGRTDAGTDAGTDELHRLEDLVASLQAQIEAQQEQLSVKDHQIETKDRQTEQLHVLLQQAQAVLPAPRESRHSWWRFWQR